MSNFQSSGRGGAGNIVDSSKAPQLQAEDLQTPTLKHAMVTTGRGGNGNFASGLNADEKRRRQDVEPYVFNSQFPFFFIHLLAFPLLHLLALFKCSTFPPPKSPPHGNQVQRQSVKHKQPDQKIVNTPRSVVRRLSHGAVTHIGRGGTGNAVKTTGSAEENSNGNKNNTKTPSPPPSAPSPALAPTTAGLGLVKVLSRGGGEKEKEKDKGKGKEKETARPGSGGDGSAVVDDEEEGEGVPMGWAEKGMNFLFGRK